VSPVAADSLSVCDWKGWGLGMCVCVTRRLALSEEDAELSHIADIAQVLKQVYNTVANAASTYTTRTQHCTGTLSLSPFPSHPHPSLPLHPHHPHQSVHHAHTLLYGYPHPHRVSNTSGSPGNLLEIYRVSWKLHGSLGPFVVT